MDLTPASTNQILFVRKLVICRNYRKVVSEREIESAYGKHCAVLREYTTRKHYTAV